MIIEREKLLSILQAVAPGLSKEENIEQSPFFVFTKGRVFTFNDEVAVSHPISFKLEGAVMAEPLFKLLSRTTAKELEVEVVEGEFRMKAKRVSAGIPMEAEIRLPIKELGLDGISDGEWDPLPAEFRKATEMALMTVSRDQSKPILLNVHVSVNIIESSDNFRITRYDLPCNNLKGWLIPEAAARKLLSFNVVKYALTEGWAHYKTPDGVTFSHRVFKAIYPNLEPFTNVTGVNIKLPDTSKDALERAGIFTDSKDSSGDLVKVTLKDGRMFIEAQGPHGWFREKMKLEGYEGEPVQFHVRPDFLRQSIGLVETVTIGKNALKMRSKEFVHVICLSKPSGAEAAKTDSEE